MENLEAMAIRQSDVIQVSSVSKVGSAQITVEYAWGKDMDEAFLDLQKAASSFGQNQNIDELNITQHDPNTSPVLLIGLSHQSITDMNELRKVAQNYIRNELIRLEGVADLEVAGAEENEVVIETSQYLLDSYGLTLDELNSRIQNFNQSISGGSITEMGLRYVVKGVSLLKDLNDKPAFLMCGIEELSPNRFQPRKDFNDQDQKQLVASIRKSGIIQPIIVRKSDSGYEIIAGERRWRAAQQAGLSSVPVIIRDAQDLDLAELSLIENIQREALNPVEEAEAYQTLTGTFNLSQEELASRVGKDRSTIANAIRLLQLPAAVKTALIEKKITTGHARPLLSLASPREQIDALEIILKKGLTVRETERLIQDARKDMPERKKTKPDPYIADLEKTLSRHLMTRVQISSLHKERGTIEIRFNSEEDLNRLYRILMGDQ